MPDTHILSVSELTEAVKGRLEGAFPFIWVRGQATNVSRPSSGHVYFTLRDEKALLAAVWFKGGQKAGERFDPLTGEVYEGGPHPSPAHTLKDGQELVCAGRLEVYAPYGKYQLVVELAQDVGQGRLQAEFDLLCGKLAAAGYFSPDRKRPLPENPYRVAVITAPHGDAIQDFLRRADERGCGSQIRIYPAVMQGEAAPGRIRDCLEAVNGEGWAEVIVLIRGGGSLEDLWAFNTEMVARAVFFSKIPVLAGIGHEADVSLADLTADARAATPTHAGTLLWPARTELTSRWESLQRYLERAVLQAVECKTRAAASLERELFWRSPRRVLEGWEERLEVAARRLKDAASRDFGRKSGRLSALCTRLSRMPERLPGREVLLAGRVERLRYGGERTLAAAEYQLGRASLRLEALNPHAPLDRGYALVRRVDGVFVHDARAVSAGESLRIVVRNGEIPVRVEGETA